MSNAKERITIVGVTVKDLYRLTVAELRFAPGGGLVQVTGKNKQGKTSLIKVVAGALGGARQVAKTAINRDSEDGTGEELIELSNGFTIQRRMTPRDPKGALTIVGPDGVDMDEDGVKYGQAKLDEWVGPLSFDPLSFYRLDAQAQRDTLLALGTNPQLPAELKAIKARIQELTAERTPYIREIQKAERSPRPQGTKPERVATKAEMDRIRELEAAQAMRLEALRAAADVLVEAEYQDNEAAQARRKVAELKVALRQAEADALKHAAVADKLRTHAGGLEAKAEEERPDLTDDIAQARDRLAQADELNAALAPWEDWERTQADMEAAKAQRAVLDDEISRLKDEEKALLAGAGIEIPGLTFDEDGAPLLHELPLSEASGREKWEFVVEVAERGSDELGVCLLDEASGVDEDGMADLYDVAVERGFQIWLTRLDPVGAGEIVHCEDGVAWNLYATPPNEIIP